MAQRCPTAQTAGPSGRLQAARSRRPSRPTDLGGPASASRVITRTTPLGDGEVSWAVGDCLLFGVSRQGVRALWLERGPQTRPRTEPSTTNPPFWIHHLSPHLMESGVVRLGLVCTLAPPTR